MTDERLLGLPFVLGVPKDVADDARSCLLENARLAARPQHTVLVLGERQTCQTTALANVTVTANRLHFTS